MPEGASPGRGAKSISLADGRSGMRAMGEELPTQSRERSPRSRTWLCVAAYMLLLVRACEERLAVRGIASLQRRKAAAACSAVHQFVSSALDHYDSTMPVNATQLTIVNYPHQVLRQKAKPVESVTEEVREVATKMLELMHEAPGVGLAAPQVALPWRMFVANPTGDPEDDQVFINPVLSEPSRQVEDYEEGCLSLPEIKAEIRRPKAITVTALDINGESFTLTSDELPARIWQHETDHLDGILILDRMTPADRRANRKLIKELEAAD